MKKQRLVLTLICIFLTVAVLLTAFESNAADLPVGGMVGERAPDFTLKDLSGKDVSLSSYKGKPVFLNFWASWCPFCKKERKELDALYNTYKDKDIVIISVSLDKSEDTLRSFMKEHPAGYIVLTDTKMMSAAMYGVRGFPTTFLIDREGVIKYKAPGFREWSSSSSRTLIDELIK